VLLQFEPHLESFSEVSSKAEATGPDVPDTPQPTGLAEARTLARFPHTAVTFAALLVPSLHDSMSGFEQSGAETSTSLIVTRGQTVIGSSTTSGHERLFNAQPADRHFTTKMHSHISP